MDPGPPLPPRWERDPQTGQPTPARSYSGPGNLLVGLAVLLLIGAAGERSILLAGIAVALLFVVWGVPALWRRWRARRSDSE